MVKSYNTGIRWPVLILVGLLVAGNLLWRASGAALTDAEQSLAADGAIACFSSSLVPIARMLIARRSSRPGVMCHSHHGCSAEMKPVSYTHLRAHETPEHLVCRLLLE